MQVDPIGMQAASLASPQTLNLYAYCSNDPINYVDPAGLFFGKLFKWVWKNLKKMFTVITVVVAVITAVAFPWSGPATFKAILGLVASLSSAASSVFDLAGLKTLSKVFGIIAMAAGIAALGFEVKNAWQKLKKLREKIFNFADDPPTIFAEVTVKARIWEEIVGAVSSVSNQISIATGSVNLFLSQKLSNNRIAAANDPGSRLKCIGGVWVRSVPKTVETIASAEAGKFLIVKGLLLSRFLGRHGASSGNVLHAADGLKSAAWVGGGDIVVGGGFLKHSVQTYTANASNSISGIKRCLN